MLGWEGVLRYGREMGPVGISFQVNCKSAWLNLMSSVEDKKTGIGNTNTVLIVCQVCIAHLKFSCPLYNKCPLCSLFLFHLSEWS